MVTLAFGRERRIRRRSDFLRVQAYGERAVAGHFVLLVAAREPLPARPGEAATPAAELPSRLGVVATRKVGDATMRNRIKRVCRECFRQWPGFVPDGIDLVVIGRDGADTLPLARVREEWTRARPALLKRCESVLRGGTGVSRPPPPRKPKPKQANVPKPQGTVQGAKPGNRPAKGTRRER